MGTYLSTPVTEKGEEYGETSQLAWGVVDMQGWRKNMEDAHVAQTDVDVPAHLWSDVGDKQEQQPPLAKVFGVFDGHGGPEVARFCQLYMVSVLTQQPTWRSQLYSPFHDSGEFAENDPANTPVGHALIQAFHAMDRLINDPLRRDEIIRLRADKPKPGEHRIASYVPSAVGDDFEGSTDGGYESYEPVKETNHAIVEEKITVSRDVSGAVMPVSITETVTTFSQSEITYEVNDCENENQKSNPDNTTPPVRDETAEVASSEEQADTAAVEVTESETTTPEELFSATATAVKDEEGLVVSANTSTNTPLVYSRPPENSDESGLLAKSDEPPAVAAVEESSDKGHVSETPDPVQDASIVQSNQDAVACQDENDRNSTEEDDDSNEAVGKEEAAELDQDMMEVDETVETESTSVSVYEEPPPNNNSPRGSKVTVMFQKLLSISGQVVVNVVRDKGTESDNESELPQQPQADSNIPVQSNLNSTTGTVVRPNAATPTIIHNGRQICNLPDHPIHAGCTAVVAVLIGTTLTVANAGDSRAVLCRAGGRAEPLSFDHKPLQEREMRRITNAGGFVNQFGRVNGNLNLSRSIGDLKYKQVPGIHPAGQMITAEPDIVQVTIDPLDEFFILGCDGIWDCMTNEQAVAYVRERIDTKTPTQIGVEMLDEIISDDPRASQGIGGDNMTVMIVDLLPHTRSYRPKAS